MQPKTVKIRPSPPGVRLECPILAWTGWTGNPWDKAGPGRANFKSRFWWKAEEFECLDSCRAIVKEHKHYPKLINRSHHPSAPMTPVSNRWEGNKNIEEAIKMRQKHMKLIIYNAWGNQNMMQSISYWIVLCRIFESILLCTHTQGPRQVIQQWEQAKTSIRWKELTICVLKEWEDIAWCKYAICLKVTIFSTEKNHFRINYNEHIPLCWYKI